MENFIDHDSLHRVEPTAKQQSEAIAKAEADTAALLKAHVDENEVKENSPLDAEPGNNVENDGSNRNNENSPSEKEAREKGEKEGPQKENFMGGQLFDADA